MKSNRYLTCKAEAVTKKLARRIKQHKEIKARLHDGMHHFSRTCCLGRSGMTIGDLDGAIDEDEPENLVWGRRQRLVYPSRSMVSKIQSPSKETLAADAP